jgi:hypothetical protein
MGSDADIMKKSWLLSFAGLCLLLLGVTSLTFGQPVNRAEDEGKSARHEEFARQRQRQIESDSRQLRAYAERSLDEALDPIFARFEERVPAFGEWAFRWRTSYLLLREGARSSALWALDSESKSFADTVRGDWDQFITSHFENIVLKPAGGQVLLREAYRRWWERLASATFEAASENILTISLYRGNLAGIDGSAAALPDDPSLNRDFRPMGPAAEKLEMRMARPVAARLAVRPPVAAAAAAFGEAVSGVSGVIISGGSMVVTIGTVLGVDYLLNRADEKLSRDDFEADIRSAISQAKADIRARWLNLAEAEIKRRMAPPRAMLTGSIEKMP